METPKRHTRYEERCVEIKIFKPQLKSFLIIYR